MKPSIPSGYNAINVGISAHKAIASRVLGFHKGIAFRDLLSGIDKDAFMLFIAVSLLLASS